jgi:hypothetical protein
LSQSRVAPENSVDSIFTDTENRFFAIVIWAVFVVEPVLAPQAAHRVATQAGADPAFINTAVSRLILVEHQMPAGFRTDFPLGIRHETTLSTPQAFVLFHSSITFKGIIGDCRILNSSVWGRMSSAFFSHPKPEFDQSIKQPLPASRKSRT